MDDESQSPRAAPRVPPQAEVDVRRPGGHPFRVRLFDASPVGCKIEFVEKPVVGQVVWVRFDGLQPNEATVRWIEGAYGGIEFKRPIYPAIFDRLADGAS